MIITKELLAANSCCKEGYARVLELNILGLDHIKFAQALRKNGDNAYADWIDEAIKSLATVKLLGDYKVTRYMVFNPMRGEYEYASTIEDAKELKAKIIEDYVAMRVAPLVNTQREIQSTEGYITSENIEL